MSDIIKNKNKQPPNSSPMAAEIIIKGHDNRINLAAKGMLGFIISMIKLSFIFYRIFIFCR
jgi:hypothetical protein